MTPCKYIVGKSQIWCFSFPRLTGNPCSYISPGNRSAARRRDGQCFKRVKIWGITWNTSGASGVCMLHDLFLEWKLDISTHFSSISPSHSWSSMEVSPRASGRWRCPRPSSNCQWRPWRLRFAAWRCFRDVGFSADDMMIGWFGWCFKFSLLSHLSQLKSFS